jgi:hypothetical protein
MISLKEKTSNQLGECLECMLVIWNLVALIQTFLLRVQMCSSYAVLSSQLVSSLPVIWIQKFKY